MLIILSSKDLKPVTVTLHTPSICSPFTPRRGVLAKVSVSGVRGLITMSTMMTLRNLSLQDAIVLMTVGGVLSVSTGTTGVILVMVLSKIGSHRMTGWTEVQERDRIKHRYNFFFSASSTVPSRRNVFHTSNTINKPSTTKNRHFHSIQSKKTPLNQHSQHQLEPLQRRHYSSYLNP